MNVHFCSRFQDKLTGFEFRVPIESGHQLFSLCVKDETGRVALCPPRAPVDGRLRLPYPDSGQEGVWPAVIVMARLLHRSWQQRIITL